MNENQNDLIGDLGLQDDAKANLKDIGLWSGINAITGFVALGVSLLSIVIGSSKVGSERSSEFFGFLIGAAISLLLNITLIQSSSALKKGLQATDQGYFGLGVAKMASYFKILGILMIIGLSLLIIVIFFVMMFRTSGRF